MKVATGLAIGKTASPELVTQAIASAMRKANITTASTVLLFLTSEFAHNPQAAIKAAAIKAHCTQIIGCSASGIFTEEDWVLDSPAAAAMVFDSNALFHAADQEDSAAVKLTLVAPNAINSTWLNQGGTRFGGVSGDATGQGAFSVWQNGKGLTQGYCELSIKPDHLAIAASHGLKLISTPKKISRVQGYDLMRIANASALQALTEAWHQYSKSTEAPPYHQIVAVHARKLTILARGDYHLSALIASDENSESVTMTTPLQKGDWLSWAIRDVDSAQVDIVKTASQLKQQLAREPAFGLLFSCLGRGPYFYQGTDQDLALLKALFPKLPIIGFYGNGEIAPILDKNEILQYSAVLGLFATT